MTRARVWHHVPARDVVRASGTIDFAAAASASESRVRELEAYAYRLAQANRQLAEREGSLRAIFEVSPDAVALVARDGTILDLNPAGLRLIEARPSDIGQIRLDMLAVDPSRTACRTLAEQVFRGETATVELEIEGLSGTRRWIETHATPLRGDDGGITALVCISRDITVRRMADSALRDSDARCRNMAEHAPIILWMANPHGLCTYVDQNWYAFSGQEPGGGLGAGFFAALHPDDREQAEASYNAATAARSEYRHEFRVRRRDGVYRWMYDQASPRIGPNGEFLGFIGTLMDIQDRKDAEEARQRHEAPLRQARKMEDLVAEHPAQESLAEVVKASARARELVQQILTFGRRQPDERRVVNLREVVDESVRLLRATLPAGIDLTTAFASDVPNVLADRSRIHQVLTNLCANAWQAVDGPLGRVTVSLSAVRVSDAPGFAGLRPGLYACLAVADNGRGIEPAIVERIFDPFFTTKDPGDGTGLGLSEVDGIVNGHDGAIAVETMPGQGATFRLYFPAVEAEVIPHPVEPRIQPKGGGQRVMYLDDEASLVQLASRLLGRVGYEVIGFTRPAEALAAFAADPRGFDVVVSDMNMPTATGLSVAAEILRQRPDTPIALISGLVTDELAERAEALGVRAVIYKPNLSKELAPLIGKLLLNAPS